MINTIKIPTFTAKNIIYVFLAILTIFTVFGIVLNIITSRTAYRITATSIQDGSTISPFSNISITFNKIVTTGFAESCSLSIEPQFSLEKSISGNTLTFSPQLHFEFGQRYDVILQCQDTPDHNFSFSTPAQAELNQEDINRLQSYKDFSIANSFQKLYEEQPWRLKFPVIEKEYDIVYSQDEDKYYAYYKLSPNSKTTKAEIQIQAENKIRELEAPTKEFVWQ